MAKLRSRMLTPPFGWFIIQDGVTLNGGSFDDTVTLITRHRKANNLPMGDPLRELEEYTCQRWPYGCDRPTAEVVHQRSLLEKGSDFLGIYSRWAATNFQTVDQVEANRRANICWKCPSNQKVKGEVQASGCCGKNKILSTLNSVSARMAQALTWPVMRNKQTPADKELYTCLVCGCPNKVSVWVPPEIYQYDPSMIARFKLANNRCWKSEKSFASPTT